MIQLAEDFFATKQDPEQLDVTPQVMEALEALHPATLSEETEGDGPVVWLLLIPTTDEVMESFLSGKLSEHQLLQETKRGSSFSALYLCSALVLPEYRNQGRAFRTAIKAISTIAADHPIRILFTWNFSEEGARLAQRISEHTGLPLRVR